MTSRAEKSAVLFSLLLGLAFLACPASSGAAPVPAADRVQAEPVVGVKIYGYGKNLDTLFQSWQGLGVNTAFASLELVRNRAFMEGARARGIPVFAIVPVFYNPEELARHPDWFAITADGKPAKDEWVEFACPNNPEYRRFRLEFIRDLIRTTHPDGLSIDFIRYFAFWEMVYPEARLDPLKSACFCPRCLKSMSAEKTIRLPDSIPGVEAKARWVFRHRMRAWTDWKAGIIASMAREIAAMARLEKPDIRLNIHLVPWRAQDFQDARKSVVGQDVAALAEHADYLSPMCYAPMVKRPAAWIGSVVKEIGGQSALPVIPSIQVAEAYLKDKLTVAEFSANLREALAPPSRGVVFWSWEKLEADPAKLEAARSILAGRTTGTR